jgi:DNA invertase Pin-like site-specific DNA recombinase
MIKLCRGDFMFSAENEVARTHKRNRVRTASRDGIETTRERPKPTYYDTIGNERVGIYARVSTCMSQQTLSYEMQQKYYSDMVEMRPNWTLERIYADEGVTGTSTKKRDEFNKMIQACREGKIDLIITKSVSRFSRNIEDVVKIVRSLATQNPPVAVYFENEGIYSLNRNDDARLAQAAINAQEESRIKSTAMESSIVMRFSSGMFLTPPLLGFDNDENGDLVVNEDEASTVRLIFFMYLCGESTVEIAKRLAELKRRTKRGETKWSAGTVYSQLVNERHCGAVLARKTHTPDYLTLTAQPTKSSISKKTITKRLFPRLISPPCKK